MKLALVFPGQGSQAVGMMQPFAESRAVRDVFAEASDTLRQDLVSTCTRCGLILEIHPFVDFGLQPWDCNPAEEETVQWH